jgi:hypothetical protein
MARKGWWCNCEATMAWLGGGGGVTGQEHWDGDAASFVGTLDVQPIYRWASGEGRGAQFMQDNRHA